MARTRSGKTTESSSSSHLPASTSTSTSTSTTTSSSSAGRQRKRAHRPAKEEEDAAAAAAAPPGRNEPTAAAAAGGEPPGMSWAARNQWVVLAVASGACAAFNGVFAKLTTNDLTTHISHGISGFFGLSNFERILEVAVRCTFFGLNLIFNGVMWTLFTKALSRGHSTTQVSIMNTSTNFVITALLGLAVFAESLPPLWWAGAAMLVAGNVIIGRKDEGAGKDDETPAGVFHDVETGGTNMDRGEEDGEGEGSTAGYGTVTRGEQAEGVLLLPVEKDDDDNDDDDDDDDEGEEQQDDDQDEDVPLLGDLEGADTR